MADGVLGSACRRVHCIQSACDVVGRRELPGEGMVVHWCQKEGRTTPELLQRGEQALTHADTQP